MGTKTDRFDAPNQKQVPLGQGMAAPPPPARQRLTLKTIGDCSREMAKVYREARVGKIDIADASRLSNMLAVLARTLEGSDLEKRVEALEDKQGGRLQ